MDTNDADYVYDSGEYGDADDTNPKDMKVLLTLMKTNFVN